MRVRVAGGSTPLPLSPLLGLLQLLSQALGLVGVAWGTEEGREVSQIKTVPTA